jgi:hypothetical protein
MEIQFVSGYENLLPYVPAWDELASASLEPNPIYESWMLLPALRNLAGGDQIQCALVFRRDPANASRAPLLCGMFPLERIPRYMGLPVSAWSFWKHNHCGLTTPLIRKQYAREVLAALFRWLASDASKCHVLELKHVPGDGPFNQLLADQVNSNGIAPLVLQWYSRAVFRPMETADAYLAAALSGKHRKALRRRTEQLSGLGRLEYLVAGEETDIESWIESFLRIEASGWKGHQGSAMACKVSDRNFFVQVIRNAFQNDRLLMTALTVGGKTIAQNCYFRAGCGSFHFKPAFDEEYARFSPGFHMECELIRYLHSRPEIEWMDSVTTADNELYNRLFLGRRTIQSLAIPVREGLGGLLVSAIPFLRLFKKTVKSIFRSPKPEPARAENTGISESTSGHAEGPPNGTSGAAVVGGVRPIDTPARKVSVENIAGSSVPIAPAPVRLAAARTGKVAGRPGPRVNPEIERTECGSQTH